MTFTERISEFFLRVFYPPARSETLHFGPEFKKAKKVLIICRSVTLIQGRIVSRIASLFPIRGTMILLQLSEEEDGVLNIEPRPRLIKGIKTTSLYHLSRAENLKSFFSRQFDLMIDLDREFNMLPFYLSRKLKPGIRIGFSKPQSDSYYNLEYNAASPDYDSALEGLFTFLKQFDDK